MSAFLGRVRNKSKLRRESKNYLFFKELVKNQDRELQKKIEDGIKVNKEG